MIVIGYNRNTQLTWGKLADSCLCNESLSFSTSANLVSLSPRRTWVSLNVSISLSLSSSIETMSCSKFASSPDNCELRCGMPSSEMVGITSHIIFHILQIFDNVTLQTLTLNDLRVSLEKSTNIYLHIFGVYSKTMQDERVLNGLVRSVHGDDGEFTVDWTIIASIFGKIIAIYLQQ